MTIKERDGGHESAIKSDQNPALDDKLSKVNFIRYFYFVKYRIYQNHELETKIYHAEEEIKNIDQTCKLIRETILQRKVRTLASDLTIKHHYSYYSSRERKDLKDMDLDKLKREKQVFGARVKNAKETWKAMKKEIPSLELKLAGAIEKRTAKEKLLVKLKKQRNKEKLNYNQQYYNKYRSLMQNIRNLVAKENITILQELSHKEV
ncbi:hypothetical protein MKW98_000686 [Papaver atlanticum]|uniref:Uncharacterized protein n=1 Tax=Papaver atlanticum TaxID=357466 RepID=A0AAD4T243_9MAGN|nr:hypothetical protein MKW98_000686 [Papaver atlanticum]